jgi:hypothetical protein
MPLINELTRIAISAGIMSARGRKRTATATTGIGDLTVKL